VTLTATYPKTEPLLSIKDDGGLREGTRYKIQKIIETKPKELVVEEQAMIMEIVNACLDVLEDAAQAKAEGKVLPSLVEERAAHEAAAAKVAEKLREEEEKKKQQESLEEERMQNSLVQDELKRRRERAKESKRKSRALPEVITLAAMDTSLSGQGPHETLAFEQPISLLDINSNPSVFEVVSNKVCIRRGPSAKCFTVRPVIPQGAGDVPTLVLKQTDLSTAIKETTLKTQIQLIENELKSLKVLRHQNILRVIDFKVHKTIDENGESETGWTVSILSEFAEKGSLQECLEIVDSLGVEKVRSWTIELLEGLQFLHEKGIVHEDIHAGNVLLVRESNGEVRPKLADAGYERKLQNLSARKQPTDTISVAKSAYWLPPEVASTNQPNYTQKTDVWDFGILFLQMLFGLTVVQKYSSPISLADSLALSDSLNEIVLKMFKADPKKRPRAVELGPSEFLATDAPILEDDSSEAPSRFGSVSSLLPTTPRRQRHDSMNTGGPFNRSRYREDFVEEGRLGKGGFGEVVKARKRLDGQIYAIKKITQKSSASLTEVLKEVRLLSQLSHPSVVRKFIHFGFLQLAQYFVELGRSWLVDEESHEGFPGNGCYSVQL
jgi:eukaryotic translation initiation factor 2-alpha kinase 4